MNYNELNQKLKKYIKIDDNHQLFMCIYHYQQYNKELQQFIQSHKNFYQIYQNDNTKNNFYYNYDKNWHHWTTDFVWTTIIPTICNKLQITDFNPNNFKKIEYYDNNINLSFHEMINPTEFKYINIDNQQIQQGSSQNFILRYINDNSVISKYHSLYKGFHKNSYIKNLNLNINRKLLIFGDSMNIPIIPILAYYFDQILIIDNRNHLNLQNLILQYNPTHFICNFISFNFLLIEGFLAI